MHSYARGFRELGHSVETYCLAGALSSITKIPSNRITASAFARRRAGRLSAKVVDDLRYAEADLVFVLKGEHLRPEAVSAIKSVLGCAVVNFYPDDPFSENHVNRLVFGAPVLREYDMCYTFARRLVHTYRAVGIDAACWLPFARDPALHGPGFDTKPPEADVVFVGNLDRPRAAWLEPLSDLRLAIYGDLRANRRAVRAWKRKDRLVLEPPAIGDQMARALARGAISINILREQNRGSHNMRSFESLACGAFTLSERSGEIQALFSEGVHLVTFGSPEELRTQVERWLRDPEGRRRIAMAGFRRVEHDTYAERCRKVLARVRGSSVAAE